MNNPDDNKHRADKTRELANVLKNFASANASQNEIKSGTGVDKIHQGASPQASVIKKTDPRAKHSKLIDRKITALDEYISEKDANDINEIGELDELREGICSDFAEILHRKCRKRIQKIVVDEQTAVMLRRALTAMQTGRDVDGLQDIEAPIPSTEIELADIRPSGNPVLLSESIIITQQLPGNKTNKVAFRRKLSAEQMKRTPTNRLTKYD